MPLKKRNIVLETNINAKPIDSFFNFENNQDQITNIDKNELYTNINDDANIDINQSYKNITSYENYKYVNTPNNTTPNNTTPNKLFSKAEIKNKIEDLSDNEMTEIFKIIKKNNEKYTTNKNGIFINISNLRNITIKEITNFLIFCDNNNEIINKEELERFRYKNILGLTNK